MKIEVLEGADGIRLEWREEGLRTIAAGLVTIGTLPLVLCLWWRGGFAGMSGPELFFSVGLFLGMLGVGGVFAWNSKWVVRITGEWIHVVPRTDGKVLWKEVEGFAWAAQPLGEGDYEEGRGLFVYTAKRRVNIAPAFGEAESRELLERVGKRFPALARKCEIRQLL